MVYLEILFYEIDRQIFIQITYIEPILNNY